MNYAELTPNDVYREFHELRSPSRHTPPPPKTSTTSFLADLPSSLHAIQAAQHVLEMFRRTLPETDSASAVLDRMVNRLTKQDCRRKSQTRHRIRAGRDWPDKRRSVCRRRETGSKRNWLQDQS